MLQTLSFLISSYLLNGCSVKQKTLSSSVIKRNDEQRNIETYFDRPEIKKISDFAVSDKIIAVTDSISYDSEIQNRTNIILFDLEGNKKGVVKYDFDEGHDLETEKIALSPNSEFLVAIYTFGWGDPDSIHLTQTVIFKIKDFQATPMMNINITVTPQEKIHFRTEEIKFLNNYLYLIGTANKITLGKDGYLSERKNYTELRKYSLKGLTQDTKPVGKINIPTDDYYDTHYMLTVSDKYIVFRCYNYENKNGLLYFFENSKEKFEHTESLLTFENNKVSSPIYFQKKGTQNVLMYESNKQIVFKDIEQNKIISANDISKKKKLNNIAIANDFKTLALSYSGDTHIYIYNINDKYRWSLHTKDNLWLNITDLEFLDYMKDGKEKQILIISSGNKSRKDPDSEIIFHILHK